MPAPENFPLLIISGQQGEGKTTLLLSFVEFLKAKGLNPGGIISKGSWKNNKRDEIKAVNLDNMEDILFCQRDFRKDWIKVGNFYVNPASEEFSMKAVLTVKPDFFVFDELGSFELQEQGWFKAFNYIKQQNTKPIIVIIRDSFLDLVSAKLNLLPEKIVCVKQGKTTPVDELLSESFISLIKNQS